MCKPCVGAKLVLRFQALIAHAFLNRSIPFSVPQIGIYNRINVSKMDFIYLRILCDSFTFWQRGTFFWTRPVQSTGGDKLTFQCHIKGKCHDSRGKVKDHIIYDLQYVS